MIKNTLIKLFAPILGMFILTLGNGFYTTFTTVALHDLKTPFWQIGVVSSMYFLGMLIGSYYSQSLVNRVGHIRAYAAFTAVMVAATLCQGIFHYTIIWGIARFLAGYCLAGLFIVIESWVLVGSPKTHKGQILSIYLSIYYMAQAVSQLLLNFHYGSIAVSFSIIAILASISIIPVCTTYMTAPHTEEPTILSPKTLLKEAPIGVYAGITAGIILSIIYTMLPLYLSLNILHKSDIAWCMLATVIGGAVLQFPIGKVSDHFDRRKVIICVAILTILVTLAMMFLTHSFFTLIIATFLLGGFSFTLYPLAISYTSDQLDASAIISALALITLCYGVGSVLGPLCVSTCIHFMGPKGTFLPILIVAVGLISFTFYRVLKKEPAQEEDTGSFKSTTTITNPLVAEEIAEQLDETAQELRNKQTDASD